MKKYIIILFLFFCILSCTKDFGLPNEYKYLIGHWKCVNCESKVMFDIQQNRVIMSSDHTRDIVYMIKNTKVYKNDKMKYGIDLSINNYRENREKRLEGFEIDKTIKDTIIFSFKYFYKAPSIDYRYELVRK